MTATTEDRWFVPLAVLSYKLVLFIPKSQTERWEMSLLTHDTRSVVQQRSRRLFEIHGSVRDNLIHRCIFLLSTWQKDPKKWGHMRKSRNLSKVKRKWKKVPWLTRSVDRIFRLLILPQPTLKETSEIHDLYSLHVIPAGNNQGTHTEEED